MLSNRWIGKVTINISIYATISGFIEVVKLLGVLLLLYYTTLLLILSKLNLNSAQFRGWMGQDQNFFGGETETSSIGDDENFAEMRPRRD